MSSRSKRSPQPGSRPPHLLITEVLAVDRAGESGEEPSETSSIGSETLAEVRYLSQVDEPDPPKRKVATKSKVASAPAKKAAPKRKTTPKRAVASRSSSAAAASSKAKAQIGAAPSVVAGAKAAATAVQTKGETTKAKSDVSAAPGAKAKLNDVSAVPTPSGPEVKVRRIHRRDLNRTWEFLKMVFRDVNRETVEYQRPRSKLRFTEVYEEDGEQFLFEVEDKIVGYAECAFDASGADNWINPRYFDKRGMRPLYVDELAVHPDYQGRGVGAFMLDQVQHLARVRGCTHLVLEVAENNKGALSWYHKRNFFRLDAAIFLAQKVPAEPELLPPRRLPQKRPIKGKITKASAKGGAPKKSHRTGAASGRSRKK